MRLAAFILGTHRLLSYYPNQQEYLRAVVKYGLEAYRIKHTIQFLLSVFETLSL